VPQRRGGHCTGSKRDVDWGRVRICSRGSATSLWIVLNTDVTPVRRARARAYKMGVIMWRCVVFLSKCDPRIWRRNISCECTSSIMHCVRVLCACAHLHVCAHSLAQKNELTNTHRTTDSWPRSAASMSGETPVSSAWDATRSATAASPPLSRLARMIEATPSALPSPTAAASSACCPSAQPDAGPLPSMMCSEVALLTVGSDFTLYSNRRRSELVFNARA
jgi:hypothetical protein